MGEDTPMTTFTAEIELFGKTATGFRVPGDVVEALGPKKRPPVTVTINGYTYRSTIAPYGDEFFLPLNRANREAAEVTSGDVVEVTIELDREPRVVEVPDDLAAALAEESSAARFFEELSYTHKREYVEWITAAKRAETRQRRIVKAVEMLSEGRRQG